MHIHFETYLNYVFCLMIFAFLSFGDASICRDKSRQGQCKAWVSNGYCRGRYNPFMNINCKRSCNFCAVSMPQPLPRARKCEDDKRYASRCRFYKLRGLCNLYGPTLCKQTCGLCPSNTFSISTRQYGASTCYDRNTNCRSWSQKGECTKNPGYMKVNCKKSCNVCASMSQPRNTFSLSASACSDRNANCKSWSKTGECTRNPGYMKLNCKKSCNICASRTNACATSRHNCQQKCINTAGSFRCACNAGYALSSNRKSCRDINECATSKHNCQQKCINTAGSFKCACNAGYYFSSSRQSCRDINECTTSRHKKHNCQQKCINTAGSFKCACNAGYYFSSSRNSCRDINECTTSRHKKHNCQQKCINTAGSFKCACNAGYQLSPDRKSCRVKRRRIPPITTTANKLNSKLCGIKRASKGRVVGGEETMVGEFPWIIGIVRKSNQRLVTCGGTLLNNRWILTAAHCFAARSSRKPEKYLIRLGEHDLLKKEDHERVVEIDLIKVHGNWDYITYNYDIALLRLKNSIEFNRYMKPICIPNQGEHFRVGKRCIVAGWGRLGEFSATAKQLQKLELPLVDHKLCTDTFAAIKEVVTDKMICSGLKTGGQDSCEGDSGGPLICQRDDGQHNFIQVGIVSWGKGCAKKGFYGVYSRVSSFRTWIENNIKD